MNMMIDQRLLNFRKKSKLKQFYAKALTETLDNTTIVHYSVCNWSNTPIFSPLFPKVFLLVAYSTSNKWPLFLKHFRWSVPVLFSFSVYLRRSPLKKATAENKLAQGNVILFLKDCIFTRINFNKRKSSTLL